MARYVQPPKSGLGITPWREIFRNPYSGFSRANNACKPFKRRPSFGALSASGDAMAPSFKGRFPPATISWILAASNGDWSSKLTVHELTEQRLADEGRDAWLREQGFRVLRLPNELVIVSTGLAVARIRDAMTK